MSSCSSWTTPAVWGVVGFLLRNQPLPTTCSGFEIKYCCLEDYIYRSDFCQVVNVVCWLLFQERTATKQVTTTSRQTRLTTRTAQANICTDVAAATTPSVSKVSVSSVINITCFCLICRTYLYFLETSYLTFCMVWSKFLCNTWMFVFKMLQMFLQ